MLITLLEVDTRRPVLYTRVSTHHEEEPMRLSSADINVAMATGDIRIEPMPRVVQPASVDLTLGAHIIADPVSDKPIDFDLSQVDKAPCYGKYALMPGEFILASTAETVRLSRSVAGQVLSKSSMARRGLNVALNAGYIDPGFSGNITLAIANLSNNVVELTSGMKIAQIVFDQLVSPAPVGYGDDTLGSHYQDSDGAVGDRS